MIELDVVDLDVVDFDGIRVEPHDRSEEEEADVALVGKKRMGRQVSMKDDEEVAVIDAIKDADKERSRVEEEKLAFERMQFDEERAERQWARKERREEREAAADLKLRKMRLMLEMVVRRDGSSKISSAAQGPGPSMEGSGAPPP